MIGFEDNLGIHLFKAYFSIYKYLKRTFQDHEMESLNPTRMGILLALADENGLIMSKLGQKLFLEKSTMTGVIDKMEADGLVERKSVKTDRRALRIYFTPKGKRVTENLLKIVDKAYADLRSDVTPEELSTTVKVTKSIGRAAYEFSLANEKKA
jgi:DNA-binding MarR family transcriptional regulator